MKKIGIFGITANPPHTGHINAALQALPFFDEIWVSPSFAHAFDKPDMASYEHRAAMTSLVLEECVPPEVKHKIVFKELDKACFEAQHKTPVYTYDLMRYIRSTLPLDIELTVILGEDSKAVLHKYYKAFELQREYPVFYATEQQSSHSTDIRRLLKELTHSTPEDKIKQQLYSLLGEKLTNYCIKNHLYEAIYERKNVFQR